MLLKHSRFASNHAKNETEKHGAPVGLEQEFTGKRDALFMLDESSNLYRVPTTQFP